MEDYQLLIDLHKRNLRQGPGGDAESQMALNLARVTPTPPLKIADLGCGTGASTLFLAEQLDAHITAVDFLQDFLDELEVRAKSKGLSEKISPLCCSIENLPFEDEDYDLIWSEGAIYNIGFETGVKNWSRYLKTGGLFVASEITWTTADRPLELQDYWQGEYPEIDVASAKLSILEKHGYAPLGFFVLPEPCWLENYYEPLQNSFEDFLKRNGNSPAAQAIVATEKQEINLYQTYKRYYSYGVYVARKIARKID